MTATRPRPVSNTAARRPLAYVPGEVDRGTPDQQRRLRKDPGVRRLLAAAKSQEGPSEPRKHHLVPRSYLERWEVDGLVRVTETATLKSYRSGAGSAARETDFYRLADPAIDPDVMPPLFFETLLGHIEGNAKGAIDMLVAGGHPSDDPEAAMWLAVFMAFQFCRGREFRARHTSMAQAALSMTRPTHPDAIRRSLRAAGHDASDAAVEQVQRAWRALDDGDLIVELNPNHLISMMGDMAHQVVPQLLFREWVVFDSPRVALITSDEPIVSVTGPDGDRRALGGVGSDDVVMFPLSPDALLVMFHQDVHLHPLATYPELDCVEATQVNLEIAAHSERWLFERGDRIATTSILLPPKSPSTVTEELTLANAKPNETLTRFFRPSRWWLSARPPVLPVERWWWQAPSSAWF